MCVMYAPELTFSILFKCDSIYLAYCLFCQRNMFFRIQYYGLFYGLLMGEWLLQGLRKGSRKVVGLKRLNSHCCGCVFFDGTYVSMLGCSIVTKQLSNSS